MLLERWSDFGGVPYVPSNHFPPGSQTVLLVVENMQQECIFYIQNAFTPHQLMKNSKNAVHLGRFSPKNSTHYQKAKGTLVFLVQINLQTLSLIHHFSRIEEEKLDIIMFLAACYFPRENQRYPGLAVSSQNMQEKLSD